MEDTIKIVAAILAGAIGVVWGQRDVEQTVERYAEVLKELEKKDLS